MHPYLVVPSCTKSDIKVNSIGVGAGKLTLQVGL